MAQGRQDWGRISKIPFSRPDRRADRGPDTVTETNRESKIWSGPLFVIGVWRSGTSLLHALLNQNPEIALLWEGDLPLFRPLFVIPRRDWPARWDFWNSSLRRHDLRDAQGRLAGISSLRPAVEAAYKDYARRKGARIWGEKSPAFPGRARRLARLFPDARFLILARDPASVCRSIIRAGRSRNAWFSKRGILTRALFNCEALQQDFEWLSRNGLPVHRLTYDQLVSNSEETMRTICTFLGTSFDPAMTSLEGADRGALPEGEHHAPVRREEIRFSSEPDEALLSPDLQARIDRYSNLWSERYGPAWPWFRPAQGSDGATPGILERARDRASWRFFRARDAFVLVVYCLLPLRWLTWYRNFKLGAQHAAPRVRGTDSPVR